MQIRIHHIVAASLWLFPVLGSLAQPFCDIPQQSAGFPSDLNCQTAVCNQDAFCCENTWDSFCASAALITPECSECLSGQTLYCNATYLNGGFPSDPACENAVCAIDNFCCSTTWDATCASLAQITPECTGCLSPVANDNCVSAIQILPTPVCNGVIGTVQDATDSGLGTVCDPFAYPNDDVFYFFEAPNSGEVTIEIDPSGTDPLTLEVLQPSSPFNECGGFWQVQCIFGNGTGNPQSTTVSGLTPESNYYIRIYSEGEDPVADGEFILCVTGELPPCNISIDPSAIQEAETCGESTNDGCNAQTPGFEIMPCNGLVTGQCFNDGTSTDSDWYQFTISENNTPVTATGKAEFPFELLIIEVSNCNSPLYITSLLGAQCQQVTLNQQLNTGTYALVIQPSNAPLFDCQNDHRFYELGLTRPVADQLITSTLGTDECVGCIDPQTNLGPECLMTVEPGGVSYQWFLDNGPLSNTNQQSLGTENLSGVFSVEVTDANGCVTLSDSHTVSYFTAGTPSAMITRHICGINDGILTITGAEPFPNEILVNVGGTTQTYVVQGPTLDLMFSDPVIVQLLSFTDANECGAQLFDADTVNELQSGLSAAFTHVPGQGSQLFNSVPNQSVTHNWLLINLSTGDSYTSTNADPVFSVDLGSDQWQMCHTVTSLDGNCAEEHCANLDNGTVGLIDQQRLNIAVYPNPNDGAFFVQGPNALLASVSVHDLSGRIVFREIGLQGVNRFINTGLPVGTYLLRVTSETGLQSTQVIHVSVK